MVRMPLWVGLCVAFWYSQNYSSIHELFKIFSTTVYIQYRFAPVSDT